MPPEPHGPAVYERLHDRFLTDSGFRDALLVDPAGTVEREYGPQAESERRWLVSLGDVAANDPMPPVKRATESW